MATDECFPVMKLEEMGLIMPQVTKLMKKLCGLMYAPSIRPRVYIGGAASC